MITRILNKIRHKYKKIMIWRRYGNKTFYHFTPPIFVNERETHGVPEVKIYDDTAHLIIGKYCSIAGGCQIVLGGNHHTSWVSTYGFYQEPQWFPSFADLNVSKSVSHGDITIGNDVWIGRNVLLLSGAIIEDGAVIGAGSVVAGHIPAYAIAVGNPCRVIKFRFEKDQIEALQKIAWWNWKHEEINAVLHLICNDDIDRFIEYCRQNDKI